MTHRDAAETPRTRNLSFDLLRLLFACMVLLAHAPEITDGNDRRELLGRLLHAPLTFGLVGIYGFFLLSGYLIVRSWLGAPVLLDFLQKRVLRIVPGYTVALLLSLLVTGTAAPGIPHWFRHLPSAHFFASILLLGAPLTPPVFPRLHHADVNGSLWTITYEFRCYLLVALFGVTGLLRRLPSAWLALTAVAFTFNFDLFLAVRFAWHKDLLLVGDPYRVFQLSLPFLLGGCFALYRTRLPFRPLPALLTLACGAWCLYAPWARDSHHFLAGSGVLVCAAYLLFGIAHLPWYVPAPLRRMPDVSYGTYLYGWPIECLWISFVGSSPWLTALVATPLALLMGWLSWTFIERPALGLKRRPTAPPAGKLPAQERADTP